MDGVPAPVAYIDRDERCHYVNRTFLQYFGLSVEQVGHLRLREVVGQGIYESAQAMLTRALQGESTAFDRLVPGANGARRWMTIRVVPDAGPSGEVNGAFVLMNDIHGLKQAQEALRASEGELRLIMDNVPARVSYIDREYRLRFLNRHNEDWLGASRNEMTGRPLSEVVGEARFASAAAAARPRAERRSGDHRAACCRSRRARCAGRRSITRRTATPRAMSSASTRCTPTSTTRRSNEDALRRANWMLSSHISNTPLAVLEWDRDFRARSLVAAGRRTSSAGRRDEVLGMPITRQPAAARGRPRGDGRA